MKRALKWILGILAALIIVAIIVAVVYFLFGRWGLPLQAWELRRAAPWGRMPMHPQWGFPGRHMGGVFWFRSIFGGLICLSVLALIVLGIVALVDHFRGKGKKELVNTVAVTPKSETELEASEPTSRPCPNCGKPVNEDWAHCPYCGNSLTIE